MSFRSDSPHPVYLILRAWTKGETGIATSVPKAILYAPVVEAWALHTGVPSQTEIQRAVILKAILNQLLDLLSPNAHLPTGDQTWPRIDHREGRRWWLRQVLELRFKRGYTIAKTAQLLQNTPFDTLTKWQKEALKELSLMWDALEKTLIESPSTMDWTHLLPAEHSTEASSGEATDFAAPQNSRPISTSSHDPTSFSAALELPPSIRGFVGRTAETADRLRILRQRHYMILKGMAGNGKSWLGARLATDLSNGYPIFWMTIRPAISANLDALLWEVGSYLNQRGYRQLLQFLYTARQSGERSSDNWHIAISILLNILRQLPVVLCIDDFHLINADPAIQSFFSRLISEAASGYLPQAYLILMTRDNPMFIDDISDDESVRGLNVADTNDLLKQSEVLVDTGFLEILHHKLAGNTKLLRFFITWYKRTMPSAQDLNNFITNIRDWHEARTYLLQATYEALNREEQMFLQRMSVFRYPIPLAALHDLISDEDLVEVQSIADRLVRRQLIEEAEDRRHIFLHDLLREFVYEFKSAAVKQVAHRRAAMWYAARQDPLEAAYHWIMARMIWEAVRILAANTKTVINQGYANNALHLLKMGIKRDQTDEIDPVTRERSVLLFTTIGDYAQGLSQPVEAIEAYQQTLRFASGDAANNLVDFSELYLKLAESYESIADYDSAAHYLALGTEQAQPETSVAARLSLGYGLLRCNQGRLDEGIRFCELGLQGQLSPAEASWGQTRLAWILILRGEFHRAVSLLKGALETLRQIGDSQGTATALSHLGRAYWQLGRWPEALQCHRESGVLAQQVGDLQLEALHYRHMGLIQWNRGEWQLSLENHSLALKLYELVGDRRGIGACLENIGAVYSDAGQFRTALWYLFKAEDVLLSCKAADFCSYAHLFIARAFAGIGNLDASFNYGHRALNVLQEWNYSNFYVGMAHRTLGELNILIDQYAKAAYHITMAEQMYSQIGSPYQLAKTWHCLAVLHLARGDRSAALEELRKAEEQFAELEAMADLTLVQKWQRELVNNS